MNLENFLETKPLYYNEIDYDRFPNIYKKIKKYFKLPKIIHIVGTNAKGSTGRTLAHILHVRGFNVGHYSSPHILKFNERIWLNGKDIDDEALDLAHIKMQKIVDKSDLRVLSYFEYTTLIAMMIFCETCDYIVLEAGLGGEFDATNVFDKNISIVTPIGYDHQSFLGESIEEIAKTKLRSVRNDLVLAEQYEEVVYELANERASEVKSNLYFAKSYLDDSFYNELEEFVIKNNYALFFKENFATAFCAFKLLGYEPNINLLEGLELFGRCQKISSHVTIDVGHNTMAAKAILRAFRDKKVILVYNSYKDKEYREILNILKPIISEVQIINILDDRIIKKKELEYTLDLLGIKHSNYNKIDKDFKYLVFGSFSVVEAFLNEDNK